MVMVMVSVRLCVFVHMCVLEYLLVALHLCMYVCMYVCVCVDVHNIRVVSGIIKHLIGPNSAVK